MSHDAPLPANAPCFGRRMKRLAIATAIGSLMACGGGSDSGPTAPAPAPTLAAANANRGFLQCDHHRVGRLFCDCQPRRACSITSRTCLSLMQRSRCNYHPM
jgi:hypothetical protein